MPKTSPFCPAPFSRRALTLIEMLVGMAITLVMMAAVVNLFANISTGVNRRQGAMELSSELRIARQRLYNDLAGATVRTDDVDPSAGYFEIVEGQYSDENPSLLVQDGYLNNQVSGIPIGLDTEVSLVPRSNEGQLVQWNDQNNNGKYDTGEPILGNASALGDYDDILALTVESKGAPFRGRGRIPMPGATKLNLPNSWISTTIESRFAEVIWFAVENPADGSRGEPGMRTIYRRVLLIAPWVTSHDFLGTPVPDPIFDLSGSPTSLAFNPTATTFAGRLQAMRDFQNDYDISVRFENQRMVPNTLADLSRREHRFAHMTNPSGYPASTVGFYPYYFPYDTNNFAIGPPPSSSFLPAGWIGSSLQPFSGDREGGDIVLSNALGFDVQVFDPGAPLYNYQGTIVPPNDSLAFQNAILGGTNSISGFGNYTDLGWDDSIYYSYPTVKSAILSAPAPLFQEKHSIGWIPSLNYQTYFRQSPAVYDTWSNYYETDQFDQESLPLYQSYPPPLGWILGQTPNVDQGTNGLDDKAYYYDDTDNDPNTPLVLVSDARNGPDDPMERETSPPYPVPLKGVQVKLRVYEPNTRAIREANVTRDMTE